MRRASLLFCLLLACLGVGLAETVTGPEPTGASATRAPVLIAGKVQPSPRSSPGIVQNIAVDSNGAVAVNGTVNATLTSGNIGVVSNTGGGAVNVSLPAGAAAINVTLPAASPVPVLVQPSPVVIAPGVAAVNVTLPSASPVPVMLSAYATAIGSSNYIETAHAGGSSEVTVKGSAGLLKAISCSNPNTTDVYLLVWDAANPTPGTTSPLASWCIPGGTGASNRGIYDLVLPEPGLTFATGLTATVCTTANGSTAPSSAVSINLVTK